VSPPRATGTGRLLGSPFPFLLIPAAIVLAAAALLPTEKLFPAQGDVELYLGYARAIAHGGIPYADVQVEYPPLAMVPMLVPYLVGSLSGEVTLDSYKWLFAGWEALLVLVLGIVLVQTARLGALGTRLRDPGLAVALRLPILVAGAALAIAFRFDLFPAVLLAIAVWATLANRPVVAGIALGLGVLAKLYPVAAAPALALMWLAPRDGRRLLRFVEAAVATVALGLLPFLVIAGPDTLTFLTYQTNRGLQIESIGGGMVILGGLLAGSPVPTDSPFKAVEVIGRGAPVWLAILPLATLAGFAAIGWFGWRRARREIREEGAMQPATLLLVAAASVLVLLVTNKVFSIQYIVWIVPFAALLRWPQFWLAAAAVALTMPIHPLLYERLVAQEALPVLILNARNALVVVLTLWVIADLAGTGVARPAGLEPTTFRSAT
jgi:hypothetical protein